jgi:hypothetical protein
MAALSVESIHECPQICGGALLAALERQGSGAAALAGECVAVLDDRDWDGDAELGADLRRALGQSVTEELTPVPVDIEQMVDSLRGGEHRQGGRLNVRTGEAWPDMGDTELDHILGADHSDAGASATDTWLYVDVLGPRAGYVDMEYFIAREVSAELAASFTEAITGKGAFARFRAQLRQWPDLEDRWHRYNEERWTGRARAWLADAGYRPAPRPHTIA